jgi:hypothetical protein
MKASTTSGHACQTFGTLSRSTPRRSPNATAARVVDEKSWIAICMSTNRYHSECKDRIDIVDV